MLLLHIWKYALSCFCCLCVCVCGNPRGIEFRQQIVVKKVPGMNRAREEEEKVNTQILSRWNFFLSEEEEEELEVGSKQNLSVCLSVWQ